MNLAIATVRERLPMSVQRRLLELVREVEDASPFVRPVARGGQAMRVRVTCAGALGWVGDGAYRYAPTDSRGAPWPPIPEEWMEVATRVGGPHPWDSAIVNWYDASASLGWHRDLAEADRSLPIVTISLGDACSWAVRVDEQEPIHRCRLESGDVTVLDGSMRLALHTVERIIPAPLLSPMSERGRISITLRVAGSRDGKPIRVEQARVEQARVEQARVEQARVEQARVEAGPQVWNMHDGRPKAGRLVYCGRSRKWGGPSPLANRWGPHAEPHEDPIGMYRRWLWERIQVFDEVVLRALDSIDEDGWIGCTCAPRPCHGYAIAGAWRVRRAWVRVEELLEAGGWRPPAVGRAVKLIAKALSAWGEPGLLARVREAIEGKAPAHALESIAEEMGERLTAPLLLVELEPTTIGVGRTPVSTMLGLSLRQPWAWFVAKKKKDVENRTWPTKVRGPIAIQAASWWSARAVTEELDQLEREEIIEPEERPTLEDLRKQCGRVVCVVQLADCTPSEVSVSVWAQPRGWVYQLKDAAELREPVPVVGQLGFFKIESQDAAKIREQIQGEGAAKSSTEAVSRVAQWLKVRGWALPTDDVAASILVEGERRWGIDELMLRIGAVVETDGSFALERLALELGEAFECPRQLVMLEGRR